MVKQEATSTANADNRKNPEAKPKKKGKGGIIAGIIIILIIIGVLAYFLMNQTLTLPQQQSQFASQFSTLQNNKQNLASFYLANAQNYNLPANKSWSIQVTDKSPANVTIGQLTISWNGTNKSLSTQNGIVNTGISPTYAVTLPHSEFMSFAQAAITKNTAAALAYYSAYYLSGNLKYTKVN